MYFTSRRKRPERLSFVGSFSELGGRGGRIYANAVFLHLNAIDLTHVLANSAAAVAAPGGVLGFTVKEGRFRVEHRNRPAAVFHLLARTRAASADRYTAPSRSRSHLCPTT